MSRPVPPGAGETLLRSHMTIEAHVRGDDDPIRSASVPMGGNHVLRRVVGNNPGASLGQPPDRSGDLNRAEIPRVGELR